MNAFKVPFGKYKARRVKHSGYSFASQLESSVFGLLKILEAAGEIKDIKVQQHVLLTKAKIRYICDFTVFDVKLGETVWVESKGFETPEWRLKLKLYKHYGPGRLRIYAGGHRNPFIKEEIIPYGESD